MCTAQDYMASSDTSSTLASCNFLGIINVLMQLRKVQPLYPRDSALQRTPMLIMTPLQLWHCEAHGLSLACRDTPASHVVRSAAMAEERLPAMWCRQVCNHPDLFEGRPIVSAFDMAPGLIAPQLPSLAVRAREAGLWAAHDLDRLLLLPAGRQGMAAWEARTVQVWRAQYVCTFSFDAHSLPGLLGMPVSSTSLHGNACCSGRPCRPDAAEGCSTAADGCHGSLLV